MPYDNQHSHVFLIDVTSLGSVKFKPGVSRISWCLKNCLSLAAISSQPLVSSLAVIMSGQVEVTTLMPLGPVQSSSVKVVQVAINRLEAAFTKATPFVDKDRGRQNVKSALQVALGYLKGLHEKLEIHLITALSLTEIDVLLSRAKTNVVNLAGLKSVNIISPLTERPAEEGEEALNCSDLLCVKLFSDSLDLDSHLRSALLSQPDQQADIKLVLRDEYSRETETLLLDLQARCVRPTVPKTKREKVWTGGDFLTALSTVLTSGVCQSLLAGPPLTALPSSALLLTQDQKEDNHGKVFSLYTDLAFNSSSLVARCELTDTVYILSPRPDVNLNPSFLITSAITGSTILPLPRTTCSEEDHVRVREIVERLPKKTFYNPLEHSTNIFDSKKGKRK